MEIDCSLQAPVPTHELSKISAAAIKVQLAVGIGEDWHAADHGSTEDIDPGGESHVEGWVRRAGQ